MSLVTLQDCHALFAGHYHLKIHSLRVNFSQHTVILGPNGSGKSALVALVASHGELLDGQRQVTTDIAWVSVEQQQALIEAEKQKDCADILDIIAIPTTVKEILFDSVDSEDIEPSFLVRVSDVFCT